MESLDPHSIVHDHAVLCCDCGRPIEPNSANMCVDCIRGRVDITENIPKQGSLQFCKFCERYLNPPNTWTACALESRELLTLCLRKMRQLSTVRLVDASFVWTEPHSKRIIVKLTVQKEVMGGAILQQVFNVEFVVNYQMCDDCRRAEAKDYWKASVQLILKTNSHADCVGIKQVPGGLDFFFATENQARKLVDFLLNAVPCKYNHSKKLISHDIHSNTYNYKYSYCVDIVPVCKDDVVCLPPQVSKSLGNMHQIAIIQRVNNLIHLIDPETAQVALMNGTVYYRNPFETLISGKHMNEYVVMDVDIIKYKDLPNVAGQGRVSNSHVLADIWVTRASELGSADQTTIHARSHLGNILKPGDTVLGYDLKNCNANDPNFDKMKEEKIPDVILVRKVYGDGKGSARAKNRGWKLKRLGTDGMSVGSSMDTDFVDFMEDLEADPVMRQGVNIYRDKRRPLPAVDADDAGDEAAPRITLQEMLDDLTIDDDPMGD